MAGSKNAERRNRFMCPRCVEARSAPAPRTRERAIFSSAQATPGTARRVACNAGALHPSKAALAAQVDDARAASALRSGGAILRRRARRKAALEATEIARAASRAAARSPPGWQAPDALHSYPPGHAWLLSHSGAHTRSRAIPLTHHVPGEQQTSELHVRKCGSHAPSTHA